MSDAFTGRPEFNREEAQPWARERKVVFTEQPASVDAASDETDFEYVCLLSYSVLICRPKAPYRRLQSESGRYYFSLLSYCEGVFSSVAIYSQCTVFLNR